MVREKIIGRVHVTLRVDEVQDNRDGTFDLVVHEAYLLDLTAVRDAISRVEASPLVKTMLHESVHHAANLGLLEKMLVS